MILMICVKIATRTIAVKTLMAVPVIIVKTAAGDRDRQMEAAATMVRTAAGDRDRQMEAAATMVRMAAGDHDLRMEAAATTDQMEAMNRVVRMMLAQAMIVMKIRKVKIHRGVTLLPVFLLLAWKV